MESDPSLMNVAQDGNITNRWWIRGGLPWPVVPGMSMEMPVGS